MKDLAEVQRLVAKSITKFVELSRETREWVAAVKAQNFEATMEHSTRYVEIENELREIALELNVDANVQELIRA